MTRYSSRRKNKTKKCTMLEVWSAMIISNRVECPTCNEKIPVGDTNNTVLECKYCTFRCKTSVYLVEKVNDDLISEMQKEGIL